MDNQGLLASLEVVVVVAIVVQDEQCIYYQSAGDGSQYGFAGYSCIPSGITR